jgi:hypothetical protein
MRRDDVKNNGQLVGNFNPRERTMHHGYERPDDEFMRRFREQTVQREEERLGATGDFPDGKLCPQDEGEIRMMVGSDKDTGKVVIDFGEKPVAFVGMTPQQAVDVAQHLIRHARGVSKEPIRVSIN